MHHTKNITTTSLAKINLYLHVLGRRGEDGYHLLDSLVMFASIGDEVTLATGGGTSDNGGIAFHVRGEMATGLGATPPADNLVIKAAHALAARMNKPLDFTITLTKNLPVASGIGGGSGNAAAVLRLLAAHWGIDLDDPILHETATQLGQDVPCCLLQRTCYLRGTGGTLADAPTLPPTFVVLVNPNQPLSTPMVYQHYRNHNAPFSPAAPLADAPQDVAKLVTELAQRHNDLTETAVELLPVVREILSALEATKGCLLARMSGTGATCFGLYSDANAAAIAVQTIKAQYANWWTVYADFPANQ